MWVPSRAPNLDQASPVINREGVKLPPIRLDSKPAVRYNIITHTETTVTPNQFLLRRGYADRDRYRSSDITATAGRAIAQGDMTFPKAYDTSLQSKTDRMIVQSVGPQRPVNSLVNSSYVPYDIITYAKKQYNADVVKDLQHDNRNIQHRKCPISKIVDLIQVSNPHCNPEYTQVIKSNPASFHRVQGICSSYLDIGKGYAPMIHPYYHKKEFS
jgi:hypothetical protein